MATHLNQCEGCKQMGSVSVDIYKKERQFKTLTLADANVVKYLIMFRSKIDPTYGTTVNIDINLAGDTFEFNQELISIYASLDKIVSRDILTIHQRKIVNLLFEGYTVKDISEIFDENKRSIYNVLDRIVERIVSENNEDWYYVMGHTNMIGEKQK